MRPKHNKIAVIALSKLQFDYWAKELNLSDNYFYVSDEKRLKGYYDIDFITVGEWWKRGDLHLIAQNLFYCNVEYPKRIEKLKKIFGTEF